MYLDFDLGATVVARCVTFSTEITS